MLPFKILGFWNLLLVQQTLNSFGYGEYAGLRMQNNNKAIDLTQRKLNLDFEHSYLHFLCKMHGDAHFPFSLKVITFTYKVPLG